LNLESIFNISELLDLPKDQALLLTVIIVGAIGSIYAIFGGLKAVAVSDTLNGYGLLIGGLSVPLIALFTIGEGNPLEGILKVYERAPEKFNVIGDRDSVLPFEVLFTGLMINQIYFWSMNQTIIQRALGAKNLKEAQKGLLFTGLLKILVPLIIVLPGVIGFYYYGESLYDRQDMIYPQLIKKVLPASFVGIFAAIVMGAVLSTFNSVLNSTATIFCIDIYKRHWKPKISDKKLVGVGKWMSAILAIFAILVAPMVSNAPDGLYQLLQQLNGIFFIPIASIMLAGFFTNNITALGAKAALLVGLTFYITVTFIFPVDIHFVHIWGIEFLINVAVMYGVSTFFKGSQKHEVSEFKLIQMESWRFTPHFSLFLVLITLFVYIFLGNFH
ncbi:MAG: solute:sodium symporter family transporter, partial [Flavobacteriaceae bacterium]